MSQSSFADAEYAGKRKKTQPPDGSIPMGGPYQTLRHRPFPFWELRKHEWFRPVVHGFIRNVRCRNSHDSAA
jgi:hypothetical protein